MVPAQDGILHSHKKKETLPFARAGMDLEIIMISEMSQSEKDKYHMMLQSNEQKNLMNKIETAVRRERGLDEKK